MEDPLSRALELVDEVIFMMECNLPEKNFPAPRRRLLEFRQAIEPTRATLDGVEGWFYPVPLEDRMPTVERSA